MSHRWKATIPVEIEVSSELLGQIAGDRNIIGHNGPMPEDGDRWTPGNVFADLIDTVRVAMWHIAYDNLPDDDDTDVTVRVYNAEKTTTGGDLF